MSKFVKKIRWNAKTRNYETLLLDESNHTKQEALEFQIEFELEHDWQLGLGDREQ